MFIAIFAIIFICHTKSLSERLLRILDHILYKQIYIHFYLSYIKVLFCSLTLVTMLPPLTYHCSFIIKISPLHQRKSEKNNFSWWWKILHILAVIWTKNHFFVHCFNITESMFYCLLIDLDENNGHYSALFFLNSLSCLKQRRTDHKVIENETETEHSSDDNFEPIPPEYQGKEVIR